MWEFLLGISVTLLAVGLIVGLGRQRRAQAAPAIPKNTSSEQLEELARLTGELAHEIKNPLSTLKVNLKLVYEQLTESPAPDRLVQRAIRKIAVIQEETQRLENILNGFMRYIGKTELQLAQVDLNGLLEDLIDFYTPQALNHLITIRQGLNPTPLFCKADSGKLKQVFLNMFINAQQAMPRGGELLVRTDKQKQHVRIQISDTGCGIPVAKLPYIFQPYYSSRRRGTGLGLASAKKIIAAHHGSVLVNSDTSKGTSFIIQLPLYQASNAAQEVQT
jgi:two-component system sensor histidine kinase HydH